jgi:glycosyltransferase 2 family protein
MFANQRGKYRLWVRPLLFYAGAVLLAFMVWVSRTQLYLLATTITIVWFAFSLLLGLFMTICYGWILGLLLRKHGAEIRSFEATLVYLESQPGKYLPGRIGSIAMQAFQIGSTNPLLIATLANIELLAICLLHMLILGIVSLTYQSPWVVLVVTIGLFLGLGLFQYDWLGWFAKLPPFRSFQRRHPQNDKVQASTARNMSLQAVAILLASGSTWLLIKASGIVPDADIFRVAGVLYLGWAVGTLALPVPAGLGVREAATLFVGSLFSISVANEQLLALAVLSRAWQLCVDILCIFLAASVRRIGDAHP